MNCYNECARFLQTKNQADLGDINSRGSCSNCLVWQEGPGRPIYQYANCPCNTLIQSVTNGGTKLDVTGYNQVRDCLSKHSSTGGDCGVMYSNWTNIPPSDPCMEKKEAEEGDIWYGQCSRKRSGNQGWMFPGVF
jgi:hypothetical protein